MATHDQRLKLLLREFLRELILLMLPAWVPRYDFAVTHWLDQEIFVAPPEGERREIDMVARVGLLQAMGEIIRSLIHIEIESDDSVANLRRRMPRYHDFLGYKHDLPVLSLAVYLDVALQGEGWDQFEEKYWEETLGLTRWRYLGLPGLDARAHVEGDNLLGVAFSVLMRIDDGDRAWLKARAMQRVALAELTAYRRHLLMEFIEAYLPLEEPHLSQFHSLLITKEFEVVRILGKTSYELGQEKGIEKGRDQGRDEGRRLILQDILEAKFGPLTPSAQQRLMTIPADQLHKIARDLPGAKSLADLGLEDAPGTNLPGTQ